jgi:hypothetical protein
VLPFNSEQFFAVFASYNAAIWPLQIGAYLLGAVAVALLSSRRQGTDRRIVAILAAMWLWTGLVYHAIFFAAINKAAYLFAVLFIVQSAALTHTGVYRSDVRFSLHPRWATRTGFLFIGYAAVLYPLLGISTGHRYPDMPMFGVTPCPVTIFTFGMLLMTAPSLSRWLLVIPFVWSLIGGSAAILLDVPQDWFLLVSGLIAVPLIAFRKRQIP